MADVHNGKISVRKALVLCKSDLSKDARYFKHIKALKPTFEVTSVGLKPSGLEDQFIDISPLRNVGQLHWRRSFLLKKLISFKIRVKTSLFQLAPAYFFRGIYWDLNNKILFRLLCKTKFEVIISNDAETLPMAIRLAKMTTPVVFDSHEFAPLQFEHNQAWMRSIGKLNHVIFSQYLKKAAAVITVSKGIARAITDQYNVDKVHLVYNTRSFSKLKPSVNKILTGQIGLVHYGVANRNREIERYIYMMSYLKKQFTLDLYLIFYDQTYLEEIKVLCDKVGSVRLYPALEPSDLVAKVNQYDIAIVAFPSNTFNLRFCMPNKLFEAVQARVAVLGSLENVEVAKFIKCHDVGFVSKSSSIEDMASALNNLTVPEINEKKLNTEKYSSIYTEEESVIKIRNIINDVL